MNKFPSCFKPSKLNIQKRVNERIKSKLRVKIYDYLIFNSKGGINIENIDGKCVEQVIDELENLGWKTRIFYRGTILFVYNPNDIPKEVKDLEQFQMIDD
jgi:hypothetical protein